MIEKEINLTLINSSLGGVFSLVIVFGDDGFACSFSLGGYLNVA
jgi:hypothetical protein